MVMGRMRIVMMMSESKCAFSFVLMGSDDSDEEDETAALMAELAKIKQERAEEKARLVPPNRSSRKSLTV